MSHFSAERALYWLWAVWYASWLVSVFWAGKSTARPDMRQHGPYQIITMGAVALLFFAPLWWPSSPRLWLTGEITGWIVFLLTLLCFGFCWWARLTMGRLWNGFVGRTENHRVVDSGPFAIVRHPIYTAIIAAAFLLAVELGTVPAVTGAVAFLVAFWLRARLEERFLRTELGTDAYNAYARRVSMLIPFGPKSA